MPPMASPLPPQFPQAQPAAPPPPKPFSPFPDRANDGEPAVARVWMTRLSKLMFDPRFTAQTPAWQQLVNDRYAAAQKVIQSVTPLPSLPKGMEIRAMPQDAQSLVADMMAATKGQAPPPKPNTPQAPQPPQQSPQPQARAPQPLHPVQPTIPVR